MLSHPYPEQTVTQKDTCTPMCIAALFTIARTWKRPKYLSVDEWIRKMWCIYIYIQWNITQPSENEIASFAEIWMDPETVIQNEVSQKEKNQYHIVSLRCGI